MSDVFMCGCTHNHRERTYHFCSRRHEQKWSDKAELERLRARVEALETVLRGIEAGCSFPADAVQRAVRDVARAALGEREL